MGETARLLGAAREREPEAMGDLLERLRPRIVLWAATRLSPDLRARIECDDVAQLVLLSVHGGFERFAGIDGPQFLAWVFSIAENRVRDLARHFGARKRGGEPEDGLDRELARVRAGARCFSRTAPSQAAARKEELARMHAALDTLPDVQRTVLRLRDLELREYDEIARTMALPSIGAARTLRCRALVALRDAMERVRGASA